MRYVTESLWVAFGAAIGANARYWFSTLARAWAQPFPWPTLLINLVGSVLLGAFSAAALARGWGWQGRLFFAVGLCGGFTTFSTFSFEVLDLMYQRSWKLAGLYAALSLALCVLGCFVGGHFGRLLFSPHPVRIETTNNPFAKDRD
ncbi:MAG: fluoride efflux transporter CrcB [Armatimonadetes bacterium]|nr:fluoride efflux transporter CrcB [Armatimonadota bacterium]